MSNMSLKTKYFVDDKEISKDYFQMLSFFKDKCKAKDGCKQKDRHEDCEFIQMCSGINGVPARMKLRIKADIKNRGFEVVESQYRKHPNIDIKKPKRGTKNSAGYDICTPIKIIIPAGGISEAIQTDIKAYMLDDEVLEIYPRSSLGFKKGLMLINTVGIIDSDYYSNKDNDGNIGFKLKNLTDKEVVIEAGEKIMQGIFKKYLKVDNDNSNEARIGGIGSTGK